MTNEIITFTTGQVRANHTITINQEDICENSPNENFFVAVNSDLPIVIVIRQRTEVIINNSECSKCHILFLLCYVVVHKSLSTVVLMYKC